MPVFPQLERLLWLHDQAKKCRYPNANRLAAQLEISAKTAQRDIACLRDRFRAPLEYHPGRRGYYYTDDLYELPCLPASQQQVICLLMARRLLEHSANGFISRELDHLRERIFAKARRIGFTPQWADKAFSAVWSEFSPTREVVFRLVAGALLQCRPIRFAYRSPQTVGTSQRTVEPHHLLHHMASWVLLAWCRDRMAWRRFHLARMDPPNVLDDTFAPKPETEWRPLLNDTFGQFQGPRRVTVVLRFTPFRSRWIREQYWHPRQVVTEQSDGGLILTLPAADFREIKMKILQFGADCEVLAPETLREGIRTEIIQMAGIYR